MGIGDQFESGSASLPAYLTVDQVAEMLQVDGGTILRWAASDSTMPVLRMRRIMRFPRERLLRWLVNREQGRGRPRAPLAARERFEHPTLPHCGANVIGDADAVGYVSMKSPGRALCAKQEIIISSSHTSHLSRFEPPSCSYGGCLAVRLGTEREPPRSLVAKCRHAGGRTQFVEGAEAEAIIEQIRRLAVNL